MPARFGLYALLSIATIAIIACGGGGNRAADKPLPEKVTVSDANLRRPIITLTPPGPAGKELLEPIMLMSSKGDQIEITDIARSDTGHISFVPRQNLMPYTDYSVIFPTAPHSLSAADFVAPAEFRFKSADTLRPRPLRNLGRTCHINAVLQLVLNSARLRETVQRRSPSVPFDAFFHAYDSQSNEQLTRALQRVVSTIRLRDGYSEGDTHEVLNALLGPREATLWINNLDALHRGLHDSANREFAPSFNITYTDIPLKDELNSFIYHRPGHWVAYISTKSGWYLADDETISTATTNELSQLEQYGSNETQRITLISYQ